MKSKATWTLVLLAVALFGFIYLFERHLRQPGDAVISPRIIPQLAPAAVNSVQVRPAGKLEIRAERTNNIWQLTKPIVYPAEIGAVEALLDTLARLSGQMRLTAQDLKSRQNPEKEFGFDPPQSSLLLQQAGGDLIQVHVGNLTVTKDQLFLQVVGTDGIFVVDAKLLRLIPQTGDDWRSTALVNLRELAFDRIAITNAGKVIGLERDPATKLWTMNSPMQARADNPKLEDLLQKLQATRVVQFISDNPAADLEACGLQTPELELVLAQGTNTAARLQFGKSPTNDAGQVYARRVGATGVVLVPAEPVSPWRGSYTDFRERRLVNLTPNLVDEIEVRGPDSFVLHRLTNDVWRVTGTNGFAADPALVFDLLNSLSTLEVAQFVKDVVTPLDFPTYKLEPPTCQFIVRTDATNAPGIGTNRVMASLQLGGVQGDLVYARRADENSVYGLKLRDVQRLPLSAWQLRERRLWSFKANDVVRLTLRQQGTTNELTRSGTNQWSVPAAVQGTVNDMALDETLHRLGSLSVAAWAARGASARTAFGFSDSSPMITIELKSGVKWTLEFGGLSPHSLPYAATQLDGQTWVFEFPWSVYQFLQTSLGLAPPSRP